MKIKNLSHLFNFLFFFLPTLFQCNIPMVVHPLFQPLILNGPYLRDHICFPSCNPSKILSHREYPWGDDARQPASPFTRFGKTKQNQTRNFNSLRPFSIHLNLCPKKGHVKIFNPNYSNQRTLWSPLKLKSLFYQKNLRSHFLKKLNKTNFEYSPNSH